MYSWYCAVSVFLLAASCSYGCLPRCYQLSDASCNETTASKQEGTAQTVIMTMWAPQVISPEWRTQRDRVLMSLLCLKLKANVTGYCVRETKVTNGSTCSPTDADTSCLASQTAFGEPCEAGTSGCACKSFYMYVYKALQDAVLPSSDVISALEEDSSKLALKVAGFEMDSFVAAVKPVVPLFNAPLQAWVLVGVGVLVAIIYGTKPLWWDRCLFRGCKGKDNAPEPAPVKQEQ